MAACGTTCRRGFPAWRSSSKAPRRDCGTRCGTRWARTRKPPTPGWLSSLTIMAWYVRIICLGCLYTGIKSGLFVGWCLATDIADSGRGEGRPGPRVQGADRWPLTRPLPLVCAVISCCNQLTFPSWPRPRWTSGKESMIPLPHSVTP